MLINEVEHIIGLSKKSIRYYESNGLLSPKRNVNNDYRIYDEEDIYKLKKIKFLRGISIEDLKKLNSKDLSLAECMKDRLYKIRVEEEKYEKIKSMCNDIIDSEIEFETIEIDKYFQKVNILGKEGFTMREINTSKSKKILGAVLSSITFSAVFIFLLVLITVIQITQADDRLPWIAYGIIMAILGLPVIGIVGNLISRIYEILGGEEDEASKY